MFSIYRLLFFIPLLNAFSSAAQVSEKHYRIYSTKLGKEVSLNDVAAEMKNYDVLFFGEEHNDSVTHYLEKALFEKLHQANPGKLALSLEMFDRDVQLVMNEYLGGSIRERNFIKDARAWQNYKDYRPMVELAKSARIDVICANAPTRYTNMAGRMGQKALAGILTADAKKYVAPLPYDTAAGPYYEKLTALTKHDSGPSTMGAFNLILSQSLWDATMAWSISQYLKKHAGSKVMQVNGRFHSDERFAAVTQLKKYSPKVRAIVLSSGTDDAFPTIDWNKYKALGDFVVITDPKVPKSYK